MFVSTFFDSVELFKKRVFQIFISSFVVVIRAFNYLIYDHSDLKRSFMQSIVKFIAHIHSKSQKTRIENLSQSFLINFFL
jgi:hypothetical protein